MSGSVWEDDEPDDDAEIIDRSHQSGWSTRLQSAKFEDTETVYDPIQPQERWLTVPDSIWTEVEE